jgi:hypothetical protein
LSLIPTTLSGWTLEAVQALLQSGVFESEVFDFKEDLPHSKDSRGKERLRSACAAFANAEGGFLIFGIADDRSLPVEDRLLGVDGRIDFPARFGDFPKGCDPSVFWEFRNPPIALPSSRVLQVVHIPKSGSAPHAVGSVEEGWTFPKRTNRGTEGMNVQEVRASFLSFYEKRIKLQLLGAELRTLRQSASVAASADPARIGHGVGLVSFDLQVLESIIADTYALTARERELHQRLGSIRTNARICNTRMQLMLSVVHTSFPSREQLLREYSQAVRAIAQTLGTDCDRAIAELDAFLSR